MLICQEWNETYLLFRIGALKHLYLENTYGVNARQVLHKKKIKIVFLNSVSSFTLIFVVKWPN